MAQKLTGSSYLSSPGQWTLHGEGDSKIGNNDAMIYKMS